MRNTIFYCIVVLLVAGSIRECDGLHLRAYFDRSDVRGYVEFGQHAMTSNLTITFNFLDSLRSFDGIEFMVTSNPSVYDDWCQHAGDVVHNMSSHGYITHNSSFVDDHVTIMGKDSVLGKSLVLYLNGSAIACSTIMPHSDVIFADARIDSAEVGGHFTFIRSKKTSHHAETFIYGELKHVYKSSSDSYDIYISADTADHKTCAPLRQIYNPQESSGNCTVNQESGCKIGDLSSKHGNLTLVNGVGKIVGVDLNLPLSGDYSIISRYLVVKGKDTTVACAKINIAGPLEAISLFTADDHKGIAGHVRFVQQTPYHFTKINTTLDGLADRVGGYHVHRFPISDPNNRCGKPSVGGHVNTWNVDSSQSPAPNGGGSLDKYEVGDLSGRYGGFHNKLNISYEHMDANLPLYGLYTILGRSIVIHENKKGNPRFVCSNIEPDRYKLKMSSSASFGYDFAIEGTVRANQWIQENGITTRTTIVVDIQKGTGKDHTWSIHDKPVDGTCPRYDDPNNPVYDPIKTTKGTFCDETNPFLCTIGDISGKVGKYDMANGKSFFSDTNLPMLTGPHTAIGHSLVMYKADGSKVPLACGNIVPDTGKVVSKLSFLVKDKTNINKLADLRQMLVDGFEFTPSQAYRINSLTTSVLEDDDDIDCFRVDFYMIDTNNPPLASAYKCVLQDILKSTTKMGTFKRCEFESLNVEYKEVSAGSCTSVSEAKCRQIATRISTSVMGAIDKSTRPPGCYWKPGDSFVWYNRATSTIPCSTAKRCLCKKDGERDDDDDDDDEESDAIRFAPSVMITTVLSILVTTAFY